MVRTDPGGADGCRKVEMSWKVTSGYENGVPAYYVCDAETESIKGKFECQRWAEEFARQMNAIEEAKCTIRAAPHGNIKKRMEAIETAKRILGRDITTEELHRWAET